MIGFLDSEEETSMPVDGSLLNAPPGEQMVLHCQSLYRSAIALAALIAAISYTSMLLEHQLDNALVFLASDECLPAKQLHEKLSRIQQLVAMTEAAVNMHENQRRYNGNIQR
jgi:hypothetical protein